MEMDIADLDDEFQDAYESQPTPCAMDLDTALVEAKISVHYFFNNRFDEAKDILKPWADTSMYHAVGTSVFAFLEATLTFEQKDIEAASDALKKCIAVCSRHRKKVSISETIGKIVKKPNYDQYTPEEIHAELCYAEALLLKALLTFIEDETLVSFIKAGLKIRSCFNSYKECGSILNLRHWNDEPHKVHFEGGVRMGIGAFNLMISLLPGRIIKLLEFIGFSGSKNLGLKELETGYQLDQGVRQVLCVITLLAYHLIVVYALSDCDGDLVFCEDILKNQLQKYPHGVWFLFFKGRLEFVNANINESIEWYTRSWKSQNIWPQFHHLCFWELMWANSIRQEWREASVYANHLLQDSCWSRTIYSYQKAALLSMLGDKLNAADKREIESLMRDAPQWKQRIAGKSLPMEKFVIKKTERYFAQDKTLVLPALEMLYLWNLFKVVGKKWAYIENVYKLAEKTLHLLELRQGNCEYDADNIALALLIKGASLRQMKSPLLSEECLNRILTLEKTIKSDHYLVPYALVELALLNHQQGNTPKAVQLVEDVKKNYTGYSLESRLHFKIHSFQMELNDKAGAS